MPVEVGSEFVDVSGVRTHLLLAGESGPALVLLHGTAIDSARLTFGSMLPELGQSFRVYAPDWPGYGQSQAAPAQQGARHLEEFLVTFMDEVGLGRAHLAGFSMGGGAAIGLALEQPQRVDRLALIDSYGLGGTVHLPLLPYLALRAGAVDEHLWAAVRGRKRVLRWFLATFVFGDSSLVTDELVAEVQEQLLAPGSEAAFMAWLRAEIGPGRLRTNYRSGLADLQVPTLILHGSKDLIVPAYRAKRASRLIPDSRLVLQRGSGHWLPREAPQFVTLELARFLC